MADANSSGSSSTVDELIDNGGEILTGLGAIVGAFKGNPVATQTTTGQSLFNVPAPATTDNTWLWLGVGGGVLLLVIILFFTMSKK